MKWLILILGVASNASASVLVKMAMMPPRKFPSLSEPLVALGNWPFWLGLGLYGAAFLLYAAALARLPLNVAHPLLTCGAVASVALMSSLVFREPFYWNTIAGIVMIVAGVALVTIRVASTVS
ncbi:multidrug transporter [Paraburkholderia sp. GAS42]|uniref:EamA family transporter n=1 Tax=Paraburkholderia sp. GAS42 TaxID=3035135 RepID=UPI003D1903FA